MRKNLASLVADHKLSLSELLVQCQDFFTAGSKFELYRFVIGGVEKPLIEMVLSETRGNQLKAARILGINRNTLHAKILKLGIPVDKWKN